MRVKSGRAGPVGGGESEEGTTNGPEEGGARRCVPTPAPPVPEGGDAQGDTPEHFAKYLREEIAKWSSVIKSTGMQLE